jgi:glycosyltransferase involved in cell wall biosynthesis
MNDFFSFSVIIPHRNSVNTLKRLFDTIPERSDIEIILVDNSDIPITKEDVNINRDYQLCWADPKRFAGGARNVGIENAHGKWLVFADADDYFTPNAFDDYYKFVNSDVDIVYFGMDGVYIETGERSTRGDMFTQLVQKYLAGDIDEMTLRTGFPSPCSKMVRHELVSKHSIRYDEVRANNDDYFALLAGYYANKVTAYDSLVYVYVASTGSIMHRRSKDVMLTRFEVILRCNQFKKQHGLGKYQGSVMYFLSESRHYGVKAMWEFVLMLVKYKQNPLIGMKNWQKTAKRIRIKEKKETAYLVKE